MSPAEVRPRVVLVDGVPMSGLTAAVDAPRAVIVAFHGGASTAAYFDCPGHPRLSLLRTAAALGYTAIALDRPGYGSSAPYPDAMDHPEQRVALAYGAIDKVLGDSARGEGVFVVGHSAGCELAVRLAADERADDANVIGLELAGTGTRYSQVTADIMRSATATQRPTGLREVLWQPAHLYPPDVLSGMTNSSGGARYEVDTTRSWPRQDFPALAARVRVPVQFSCAEHERVWQSDSETLAQIGAMFTASPRFVINEQGGTGHNMSLSINAAAYHLKVLSFVEECVVATTSTKLEAG
ncbi:alpha/beta hydrolase [Mycobacterium deserti]|uniref:Lysophospholipase n=1 Tax=Mycobacterium deserti TaxID=2978347 RepID=A0ABT2MED8_9MYCO|nr:alpha/beta hydrolase [Mycobacterium deserti]MCT7660607.1 lysophospholipase [Mycobacterium deserti]